MMFNQLLIKQLLELRRVDLPHFGSIVLDRHPATIDFANQLIHPPSVSLRFIDDQRVDETYCPEFNFKHLTNIGDIKEQFLQELQDGLNDVGSCEIKYIGSFERKDNKISFQADKSSPYFSLNSDFEPVHFTPIRRSSAAQPQEISQNRKGWHWKAKAIVTLTVVNLVLLLLAGIYLINKETNHALPTGLPEERVNVKPSDNLPLPNAIPLPKQDSLDSSEIAKDSIGSNLELEETVDTLAEPMHQTKKDEDRETNISSYKDPISEPKITNDPLKSRNNCHIIIGSFGNLDNVQKMVKQVEAKQYKPYTQQVGGLTRVGITLDCNQVEKELDQIKRIFNDQAWILY